MSPGSPEYHMCWALCLVFVVVCIAIAGFNHRRELPSVVLTMGPLAAFALSMIGLTGWAVVVLVLSFVVALGLVVALAKLEDR